MRVRRPNAVHPGSVLLEDFLTPLALAQYRLAKEIGVPARRLNEIVLGKRGISADTALRLSKFFGTSAEVWMNLQSSYDLRIEAGRMTDVIRKINPLKQRPAV